MPKKTLQTTFFTLSRNCRAEVYGEGKFQDYGMRNYDPRIARINWSIDPLTNKFPMLTPYQFSSNSPIWMTDVDGDEGIVYTVDLRKNSDGTIRQTVTTEFDVYGKTEGVLYKFSNVDYSYSERYIPDAEIVSQFIPKPTIMERGDDAMVRFGGWLGNLMLSSPVNTAYGDFSYNMKTAEYVGFRVKVNFESFNSSMKGSVGFESGSENTFRFVTKGGMERKGGLISFDKELKSGDMPKIQLGFYWKHNNNFAAYSKTVVDGSLEYKMQTYSKVTSGRFSFEKNGDGTDEVSLTLGKNKFKIYSEAGVKASVESKWKSNVVNLD